MIKTITAVNEQAFDDAVNEFEKTHNVFATQTHVNFVSNGAMWLREYTAVIFYRGKDDYNKS